MGIQCSGELRLRADIALEVDGTATGTNVSLGALSNTAEFSDPDAMSEFYGYVSGSEIIRLIYTDEIGGGVSSSLWNQTTSSNEGTRCNDAISLSANVTNAPTGGIYIFYEVLDENDSIYSDAFDVYYSYNVSSNNTMKLEIRAGYLGNNNISIVTTQIHKIVDFFDTGSGTGTFSVAADTSGNERLLFFNISAGSSVNNINFTITGINTTSQT